MDVWISSVKINMFISKERNFIYLRVPKTGSTSMMNYLIDNLGSNEGTIHTLMNIFQWEGKNLPVEKEKLWPHSNITEILEHRIIDNHFLEKTNIYACLRNPVERFLSCCYHFEKLENDVNKLVEKGLKLYTESNFPIFWPQSNWCFFNNKPVNKIFLYKDFDKAAQEMTGLKGIVNYQHRDDSEQINNITTLDFNLVQEIEKLYIDDVILYKSLISNSI